MKNSGTPKGLFINLGLLLFSSCCLISAQETRVWTASDSDRTFEGLYVYHKKDIVCLADKLGKEFTIPIEKISIADRIWLRKKKYEQRGEQPAKAIDTLVFDDNASTLLDKLSSSNLFSLKGTAPSSIEDLNKTYQIKEKVGDTNLSLSVFLDELNLLSAIQLISNEQADLDTAKANWESCKALLSELAGLPQINQNYPSIDELKANDNYWVTSQWKTKSNQHLSLAIALNEQGQPIIEARILPLLDEENTLNPELLAQIKENLTS